LSRPGSNSKIDAPRADEKTKNKGARAASPWRAGAWGEREDRRGQGSGQGTGERTRPGAAARDVGGDVGRAEGTDESPPRFISHRMSPTASVASAASAASATAHLRTFN
jgi:hypothetical protein